MKAVLKALLPVSALSLCLVVAGCNSEEAPPTPEPPPATPAPAEPAATPTPTEAAPTEAAPAEAPADAPKPAEEAPKG